MKTKLLSKIQDLDIIDITHQIRLNNLIEAGFVCRQLHLDENQTFIIMVKVGNSREIVVYQHLLNFYHFPNNGIIGTVFEQPDLKKMRIIRSEDEIPALKSFIKEGIDSIHSIQSKVQIKTTNKIQINSNFALADCIFSDNHGNCFFNVHKDEFESFIGNSEYRIRIQHYPGMEFKKVNQFLDEVKPGVACMRFSKSGYLKLQINLGNDKQLLRIKEETKLIIEKL